MQAQLSPCAIRDSLHTLDADRHGAGGGVHGAGARAPSDGAAGGGAKDDVIDAEFEDKS
jgi:hypothetical protein